MVHFNFRFVTGQKEKKKLVYIIQSTKRQHEGFAPKIKGRPPFRCEVVSPEEPCPFGSEKHFLPCEAWKETFSSTNPTENEIACSSSYQNLDATERKLLKHLAHGQTKQQTACVKLAFPGIRLPTLTKHAVTPRIARSSCVRTSVSQLPMTIMNQNAFFVVGSLDAVPYCVC